MPHWLLAAYAEIHVAGARAPAASSGVAAASDAAGAALTATETAAAATQVRLCSSKLGSLHLYMQTSLAASAAALVGEQSLPKAPQAP